MLQQRQAGSVRGIDQDFQHCQKLPVGFRGYCLMRNILLPYPYLARQSQKRLMMWGDLDEALVG